MESLGAVQDCYIRRVEFEVEVVLPWDPTIQIQSAAVEEEKCLFLEAYLTVVSYLT